MFQSHHTAISVSDIQKSLDFYHVFGFTNFYHHKPDDGKCEIYHLKLENFVLEIFCFQDAQDLPDFAQSTKTDLQTIGTKHFALQVNNITEAYQFCHDHSIEIVSEIKTGRTEITYFFIKDPDGILVEIVEDNR